MSRKFSRVVTTPAEYREMLDAADTMDLELAEAVAVGTWETPDGEPAWPANSEIVDDHHTYFSIEMDGSVQKAAPATRTWNDNDGGVRMVFHP